MMMEISGLGACWEFQECRECQECREYQEIQRDIKCYTFSKPQAQALNDDGNYKNGRGIPECQECQEC